GVQPGTQVSACPRCGGSGRLQQVARSLFGEFIRTSPCPQCGGSGRLLEHPYETCGGAGRTLDERTIEVEIPAGIHDGQRIRLSGEGHAGALGGCSGVIYVVFRARPAARFVREANVLLCPVYLKFMPTPTYSHACVRIYTG